MVNPLQTQKTELTNKNVELTNMNAELANKNAEHHKEIAELKETDDTPGDGSDEGRYYGHGELID
jgi:peptidoglycan hydrolase CwlO-like protein